MEVFTTLLALLENHKVSTITIPAMNKSNVGVGTFWANTPMLNSEAATPEAIHASYDCHAAMGTPIKFTKSFPAKASAPAKEVPPIPLIRIK